MDDRVVDWLERYHAHLTGDAKQGDRPSASHGSSASQDSSVSQDHQPPDQQNLADEPPLGSELSGAVECLELLERVRRQNTSGLPPVAPNQPTSWALGRFEVIRELGRGGHGIVFLAWDPAARRNVAIKTPHPDVLFTPAMRERFLHEGIMAARLTHANIVSVWEVDHSGPVCFIVSPYCEGQSLASFLLESEQPVSTRMSATWIAELADGVEHAHRHGILHRDIKPGNVILEALELGASPDIEHPQEVALVPRLTDFGLAKMLEPHDSRTRAGEMLGTPAYMAPEQIDTAIGAQGPATDVHGLGTVLYELLTGRAPFQGANDAEVIRQVIFDEPQRPRATRKDVPRDLEAICLKCLARRPSARYASASELAADLRRFLNGQVTRARPLGIASTIWKWSCRHPTPATAALISVLSLMLITGLAVWHAARLKVYLEAAELAESTSTRDRRELQQLLFYRTLQDAHRALEDEDAAKAGRSLATAGLEWASKGFLCRHLNARCFGNPLQTEAHQGHVHSTNFSPDGKTIATAGADGVVAVWNLQGERLREFRCGKGETNCARFSPNGKILAVAEENRIHQLDLGSGESINMWRVKELEYANQVAWSPDGQLLATAGMPSNIVVLRDRDSENPRTLEVGHEDEINDLAFSPDGLLLATAASDGKVRIWEISSGEQRMQFSPDHPHITCVRFSPDGQHLGTCGVMGSLSVWHLSDGARVGHFQTNTDRIDCLIFLPDHISIAFGDGTGIVRQWDWRQDRTTLVMDGRRSRIMTIDCGVEGKTLAVGTSDGWLTVWDTRLVGRNAEVNLDAVGNSISFSTDSSLLFAANASQKHIGVYTREAGEWIASSTGNKPPGELALTEVNGSTGRGVLAINQGRRQVVNWHPDFDDLPQPRITTDNQVHAVAISSNGHVAITAEHGADNAPNSIRLWRLATGRNVADLTGHQGIISVMASSSRGHMLAGGGDFNSVHLWSLADKQLRRSYLVRGGIRSLAFSGDGQYLASGDLNGLVRLWPTFSNAEPRVLPHKAAVTALAFSPDEPLLVTGDAAGSITLWNVMTGEELLSLGTLTGGITQLEFSRDAQWLAAGSSGTSPDRPQTRLWHAPK